MMNTEEKKAVLEAMGYEFCRHQAGYWCAISPDSMGDFNWADPTLEVTVRGVWHSAVLRGLVSEH
jgi:hypothetical protein